jgi:hypothetical protein
LFVSIAAQNGGGGSSGEIDVLNGAGDTVAHYLEGGDEMPLDPRGLFFVNNTELLVANGDPGIQLLTQADFAPGSPIPEPSSWAMLLIGFAASAMPATADLSAGVALIQPSCARTGRFRLSWKPEATRGVNA